MSKLGDIVEILDFKRIPLSSKDRENKEKVYPYYGAQGIIDYVDEYIFDGNYILVAEDGNNLKSLNESIATWASGKFWVNNHAHILGPKDGTDLKYVFYLLKTMNLSGCVTGSAQPKLTQNNLASIELNLPDYETQTRVSTILSSIDNKIENNNKINAELESLAKTIYDYWFLQFEFPNEEGKPYKSSGGKMVWNEELKREIPEGWKAVTLGSITNCLDSQRVPLSSSQREEIKGTIPYYGATGVMGYVNQEIFNGDYVLVAEDGSVMDQYGHPIIQRITGKTWVNNHAHVLKPLANISCKLLMMMLKDIWVVKIKTGSIQMKINQENLNNVKLLEIPEDLKESINKKLEYMDSLQLKIQKENNELSSLRDFLLPMLMNGQVQFK